MNPQRSYAAFPSPFPPLWASAWGEDEFGLYAEFQVKEVAQRCRWIPPGTFLMGSPESEHGREPEEGPQHKVGLDGFWLADTACTQRLWREVMRENPSQFSGKGMSPVDSVSWDDAQFFFKKLNKRVPGLLGGLPTEAQWEYACRAGTTTPFSFGDKITIEQVNYDGNHPYTVGPSLPFREMTVAVGSLPPNPWGLYEMHGNVWEWCSDRFEKYSVKNKVNPEFPGGYAENVMRGGSWLSEASNVRSASRNRAVHFHDFDDFGLRIAPDRAKPEPA